MPSILQQLQDGLADRYRVEHQLGEGGMAVVFRAIDLKHDRPVAVKVLRPELSAVVGADRFLREIQVTAQLQHPHILPLYDSGAIGDLLYYVMPLVTGESLRDRLTRERQMPVDEAVGILRAIAGALDYAHRQGILHRDIKPENILLQDRQPLLADFGIALAVRAAGGNRLTQTGLSIGTPHYMSPEQVGGDPTIDARSDIYALACVGYEMLAGEPPFTGPNFQAVITSVMTSEAKSLTARRRTVPDPVAAAIHQGLERLPADRQATAAEFAAALSTEARPRVQARRRPAARLAAMVAAGVGAGALIGWLAARAATPAPTVESRRWSIILPDSAPVALAGPGSGSGWQTAIALSPAGDRLAYVTPRGGTTRLMLRSMVTDSVVPLPGTEGAYHPFFSPDGEWIGFFSGNLLRKVPTSGGAAVTLIQVSRITGATWTTADEILVFQGEGFELHRVSASGVGQDSVVQLRTQFGTPHVLPDREWAVGALSSGQLAMLSLRDGTQMAITRRGVLPLDSVRQADLLFGTSPRWVEPGYLVYGAGDGDLMAMPFDGGSRQVRGEPVRLVAGMRMEAGFGYAAFTVSPDGTLVYLPGRNQLYVNIAFISPNGAIDTLPFPRAPYTQPRVSPDGSMLAAQVRSPVGGWEVLLMDLTTGVRQRVPVEGNYRPFPASWLPSGRELMIGTWDPVEFVNYGARIQSLETGQWRDISLPGASYMTVDPTGERFIFSDWRTGDLYLRGLGQDTTRVRIPARGITGSFSPDGKWASWGGVDGGVAVSPIPPTGAIYPVVERGQMPLWTPDGTGLIYRDGSRYYRVPISTTNGFRAGRPMLLAEGPFLSTFAWNHDIAPDGRVLTLLGSQDQDARQLGVITGFPHAIARHFRPGSGGN
jgi:eukaryotic-like serine/threonine-protein kinase